MLWLFFQRRSVGNVVTFKRIFKCNLDGRCFSRLEVHVGILLYSLPIMQCIVRSNRDFLYLYLYYYIFYCVIWTRKDANINSDSLDFFSFLFVFSFLSMKYSIISQQISLSELKHFLSMLYILSNEWFLPVYYPLKGNFKSCIVLTKCTHSPIFFFIAYQCYTATSNWYWYSNIPWLIFRQLSSEFLYSSVILIATL